MGINRPLVFEIARNTWLINEYGLANVYVLKGRERSLVIDAGSGYCSLRAIVEDLVDTPYDVVITHAHYDSVGAMHQFDHIHINELDWVRLPVFSRGAYNMEEYRLKSALRIGTQDVWTVTPDMINCGSCNTMVEPVDVGDRFELGDRTVTAYTLPGHTQGHMYYIDDTSRIAFVGDAVCQHTCIHLPVAQYLRHLEAFMAQHEVLYDRIFTAHTAFCGDLDIRSLDFAIVENIAQAYRQVLQGTATVELRVNPFHPRKPPRETAVYGEGPLAVCAGFRPCALTEEDEQHCVYAHSPFPADIV